LASPLAAAFLLEFSSKEQESGPEAGQHSCSNFFRRLILVVELIPKLSDASGGYRSFTYGKSSRQAALEVLEMPGIAQGKDNRHADWLRHYAIYLYQVSPPLARWG